MPADFRSFAQGRRFLEHGGRGNGSSMIAIVDYGMGNLGSVQNMLSKLGAESIRSSDPAEIAQADRLILAGIGGFDGAMERLESAGLIDVLNEQVTQRGVPILGVCLGMQVMAKSSTEGVRPGLGWLDAEVVRFEFPVERRLPVPHMGWEVVAPTRPSPLFDGSAPEPRYYFSHAFHLVCGDEADVAATTTYGYEFAAAIHRDNILGTQFHPEKSHVFGLEVYRRFVELPAG
jgi:glutamine amidotransferase